MDDIGRRIKFLRTGAGLTQEEFGRIFGIVKSTVSLYENGKSTPSDQIKTDICKYFGVSMDYLLGLSDNSAKKPSSGNRLSSDIEEEASNLFNSLPSAKQEAAIAYLRFLSKGDQ